MIFSIFEYNIGGGVNIPKQLIKNILKILREWRRIFTENRASKDIIYEEIEKLRKNNTMQRSQCLCKINIKRI